MKRTSFAAIAVLLALVAACEFPTTFPRTEMTWNVPGNTLTIPSTNFLPSGVAATPVDFALTLPGLGVTHTLGTICAACAAANGTTVPKPAFSGSRTGTITLSSSIVSLLVTGGSALTALITNNYSFDPLRPSSAPGAATGWITIAVMSGAVQLGRDSIDGASVALPPGSVALLRTIPLSGPMNQTAASPAVGPRLSLVVTVNSPMGDPVLIDASKGLAIIATPTVASLGEVASSISGRAIAVTPALLDLSGVDKTVSARVDSGALFVDITNQFGATGALSSVFVTAFGDTIVKPTPLPSTPGSPAQPVRDTISLSGPEVQRLLGRKVAWALAGTIGGSPVIALPSFTAQISWRLVLYIRP